MKKERRIIIRIVGIIFIVLLGVVAAIVISSELDTAVVTTFTKNENLPTIRDDWQGNPVDQKGRFVNEEFPYLSKATDIIKWTFSRNPQKAEKQHDAERLEVRDPSGFFDSDKDGILWLGHAGFFIRLNGVNILADEVFGKPPFVRTYVDVPSPLGEIKKLDYILISHDHRDHCDETTIKQLTEKFPDAVILAGLKMDELLDKWKNSSTKIQTAGWYQQFATPENKVKIFFLPSRHWSRRGLFDTNERLWGSFIIQSANKTIYFGGDSGYDEHYKKIARLFPKIDYALIGIGAYKPRWIMQPNHNSPDEAWQAFVDLKAGSLIPMHYGRFDLSDEPPSEPPKILREAAASANSLEKIKFLQINESLFFDN